MSRIAIVTDSNSGITQKQAKELGITVLPMPFYINGEIFYEDVDLSQERFFQLLTEGGEITTSMPLVGSVTDLWDGILKEYDEILHIPMSSGLSSSCETSIMLSNDYSDRVFVVDNHRISVTLRFAILDALQLIRDGRSAAEIKKILEEYKSESSIYIMVDTLTYLKKGGRITPAAAALGSFLKLKPVLQIQGGKLDAFAKARTVKQAKTMMIDAIKKDIRTRFQDESGEKMNLAIAYAFDAEAAARFKEEVQREFPNHDIVVNPISMVIECHLGPGAIAVACSKKIDACLLDSI
ncbi:MAG: DegV family protein [Lachnospiraceae bacterium]